MPKRDRPYDLTGLVLDQARLHAIVVLDPAGIVVDWKGGAESILGYTAAEVIGQSISILFLPEDIEKGIPTLEMKMARESGEANDDRWMVRKDGGRFWASGSMTPLEIGGDLVGYVKIFRNRTDNKAHIESLDRRIEEQQRQCERKDDFIAMLAHDLRSPLMTLRFGLEILQTSSAKNESTDRALRTAQDEMSFMHRLIDNLMECRHAAAGGIELRREKIVLQDLIRSVVATIRTPKDVELTTLMLEGPIHAEVDSTRMQQLLRNLLDNALKHTKKGNVWVKASLEGEDVVLKVDDTGTGILPEHLPYIFELFTQVEPLEKTHGGIGIGLSIVKEIAVLHGGTVQVLSDGVGKGSSFIVRFPAAEPAIVTRSSEQ